MSEKLCLQWNDFKDNVICSFGNLREENDFADVTLVCEDGKQVEAHKVILATSSPFFQKILKRSKHPHPLIYMRGIKSEDLLAIVDFLYCGETNVYQENLDTFLAIAEELQLKGLMGKADDEEVIQKEASKMPAPEKMSRAHKKETNISRAATTSFPSNLKEQISDNAVGSIGGTVALPSGLYGDLQKLDEQTNSMMDKTSRKMNGMPLYICRVCGKEAINGDIKKHIEANHLEGVSIPCNFCEKMFRSRNSLTTHKQRFHKDQQNML